MQSIGPLNEMLDIREDEYGPFFMLYPLSAIAGRAYWGTHYPVVIAEHDGRVIGVAVWALIGSLEAAHANAAQAAKEYDIPVAAVEAARAYYLLNKPLIDARRAANRTRSLV